MKPVYIAVILLLSSFSSAACEFTNVSFNDDFQMARLDGCKKLSAGKFLLSIQPENRPINHSPWYAFKVTAKSPAEIDIHIQFDQERPRYLPKMSTNGTDWEAMDFTVDGDILTFKVTASKKALWIAGQELIDNNDYQVWIKSLAQSQYIQSVHLGKSHQGMDIMALLSERSDNKEWLVLLGRQHPPEVTGVLAMLPFTERMLAKTSLAERFRNRFNILVVPNLNPDGVLAGHWRHSSQGIDLNRDWINFSQPETRLVRDKLNDIVAKGGKMIMAVDFHSTQQDIFYTMPTDYGMVPATLVENWLDDLKSRTVSSFVVRNKPGSSPGRGIFKQYFTDTFKVHAITYEMGDNTDRTLIKHVANQAADSLMETLLKTDSSAFYVQKKL